MTNNFKTLSLYFLDDRNIFNIYLPKLFEKSRENNYIKVLKFRVLAIIMEIKQKSFFFVRINVISSLSEIFKNLETLMISLLISHI